MIKLVKLFLVCLISSLSLTAVAQESTTTTNALPNSLAPILTKVMPTVVNVVAQGDAAPSGKEGGAGEESPQTPTDRGPENSNKPRKFENLGSGVIMDPRQGFIITNDHVIRQAKTIVVTLNNGRRLNAKVIGSDPDTDIAVLQVKAEGLSALPIADSDKLRVGDFVIAIGNPFGLNTYGSNQSATFGVISALQRSDLNIEGVENFIQTDAAINPGNSGGALVNTQGELIGINTAIISPYGGNIGIGFAIPINMARNIMEQIIKFGSVHRGLMGIFVQQLTPELTDAFNIPPTKGALVTQVNQSSPAEQAGLKAGDIILTINGHTITDATQVKNIIGLLRVDSTVKMDILRENKKVLISAVVTDVKKHEEHLQARNPFLYGLALRDLDQESPLHGHIKGVVVTGSSENNPGWRAGIRPGDVIVAANKTPVANIQELQKVVDALHDDQLVVRVLRGPGALFIVILK